MFSHSEISLIASSSAWKLHGTMTSLFIHFFNLSMVCRLHFFTPFIIYRISNRGQLYNQQSKSHRVSGPGIRKIKIVVSKIDFPLFTEYLE